MNRLHVISLLLFLASCSSIPNRPDRLGLDPLNFQLPKVESWKMKNGIEVFFYHNDELPLVQGKMYFRGGSLVGDRGITGLAEATGEQMRAGGVLGIKAELLDKELDSLAASVGSDFSEEFGHVGFFSLKEDFERVFEIFSKVIREPAFASAKLDLWKSLVREGINGRKEQPNVMAKMTFAEVLFGKGSPYSSSISEQKLKLITPESMKKFHQEFVNPNHAYLSITGSITKQELQKALEQNFGDWIKSEPKLPEFPKVSHQIRPGIYVLEGDFDQASILVGHRGPPRLTEDQYAIKIFNQAFGDSGFSSVLTKKIRTEMGLAYSIFGGLYSGAVEGIFQIQLGTRVDQSLRAVSAVLDIVEEARKQAPSEFQSAKSATEKSFVFKFDNQDFIPEREVLLRLYGYPKDYDAQYLKNIEAVSKDEVKRAANKWINPEQLCVVIVGRISAGAVKKEFAGKYDVYQLEFDTEPKWSVNDKDH